MGKCRYRTIDTVFAQQVQRRIGGAIGVIGDVVRMGASKLVVRVQIGDLQNTVQIQLNQGMVRQRQEIVEVQEIGQTLRCYLKRSVARNGIGRRKVF